MPAPWYQRLARPGGFWILLLVLLAYWPLSTFQFSISAGDTLDCWLPWRFFLAATMQDGALPAWNPYQQMGYPVHADLQGPAWYPEALLIGGTLGHGVYTLSLLFLGYVALGGWGMQRLAVQLGAHELPAFLAGAAYALSGFFTGHAMHFYAVISAAWMPWLFVTVLRMLDGPTISNAMWVAVVLFFLITGGNHTFLIIGAYPLVALGIHALYKAWVAGDKVKVYRTLASSGLALLLTMLLAIGTLHALWEVGPYIDRARGMALADASVNPFTLRAAISLLIPWVATNDATWLGTDVPMANGYFGLLMLPFAIIAIIRARGGREWVLLLTAVLAGAASFGPLLPVHGWLWGFVPGMDLFRFPAYFFFFVPFLLLPLAAKAMPSAIEEQRWRRTLLALFAILGLSVLLLMLTSDPMGWPAPGASFRERMTDADPGVRVIVHGGLMLVLLVAAFIAVARRWNAMVLNSLLVVELLLAVQFTQWATSLGPEPPAAIAHAIRSQPRTPILPELRPMAESRDGSEVMHPLWRNTQLFRGIPTHDGFNSFWLRDHLALERDHPRLLAAMKRMPLVYLAGGALRNTTELDPLSDSAAVVLEDASVVSRFFPATARDRVELQAFDHNAMEIEAHVEKSAFLIVQQNHYPGWRILVDGSPVPVHRTNVAAFGAIIPAGDHAVRVEYHKPILHWLRWISFGTFFFVLFLLVRGTGRMYALLVALLMAAFAWAFLGHRTKAERVVDKWKEVRTHVEGTTNLPVVINTDRAASLGRGPWELIRIDRPFRTEALDMSLPATSGDSVWVGWAGLPYTAAMRVWFMDRYGLPQRRVGDADAGAWLLVKNNFGGPAEELLHRSGSGEERVLVDPGSPYTAAYRVPIRDLRSAYGDHLVIDARFHGSPGTQGRVVMERKRGDRTTDYRTVPFGMDGTDGREHSVYVVRPIDTLGSDDEELVIYLWNESSVPVTILELRVRLMELEEWLR